MPARRLAWISEGDFPSMGHLFQVQHQIAQMVSPGCAGIARWKNLARDHADKLPVRPADKIEPARVPALLVRMMFLGQTPESPADGVFIRIRLNFQDAMRIILIRFHGIGIGPTIYRGRRPVSNFYIKPFRKWPRYTDGVPKPDSFRDR
jgi:hypothetical protein